MTDITLLLLFTFVAWFHGVNNFLLTRIRIKKSPKKQKYRKGEKRLDTKKQKCRRLFLQLPPKSFFGCKENRFVMYKLIWQHLESKEWGFL